MTARPSPRNSCPPCPPTSITFRSTPVLFRGSISDYPWSRYSLTHAAGKRKTFMLFETKDAYEHNRITCLHYMTLPCQQNFFNLLGMPRPRHHHFFALSYRARYPSSWIQNIVTDISTNIPYDIVPDRHLNGFFSGGMFHYKKEHPSYNVKDHSKLFVKDPDNVIFNQFGMYILSEIPKM